jgi:hypothetical protein
MFGRPYNLLMQHGIYRALPHREGGGVPRDIVTGHYDRAAVRAQLERNSDVSGMSICSPFWWHM